MGDRRLPPLMEYFTDIQDPRRETKNKKYPLIEVIVISFLAVMSGADGWESIFNGNRIVRSPCSGNAPPLPIVLFFC